MIRRKLCEQRSCNGNSISNKRFRLTVGRCSCWSARVCERANERFPFAWTQKRLHDASGWRPLLRLQFLLRSHARSLVFVLFFLCSVCAKDTHRASQFERARVCQQFCARLATEARAYDRERERERAQLTKVVSIQICCHPLTDELGSQSCLWPTSSAGQRAAIGSAEIVFGGGVGAIASSLPPFCATIISNCTIMV